MAANLGERLLGEVYEEQLDEFLHDLRTTYYDTVDDNALERRLGIKEIDDFLDVFMKPTPVNPPQGHQVPRQLEQTIPRDRDEERELGDGQQLQEETRVNPLSTEQAPTPIRVHRDTVLEISSTSSASGKSQLLYYLSAIGVLPSVCDGIQLGGQESAVVFIDTDGRFEAERLQAVARGIIQKRVTITAAESPRGTEADNDLSEWSSNHDLEVMLVSSLKHVHVFRPQSSSAFLATLRHLETYLYDLQRHISSDRPLRAILIDSASAFFWQDRLQDEVARTEEIGRPHADIERERQQKQSFYLSDLYADLAGELKRLQKQFSCSVVYTTIAASGRSMTGSHSHGQYYRYTPSGPFDLYNPLETSFPDRPAFRSTLPAPWGIFPNLRLVVQRDAVRPFPPSMTPYEAQRDARMRQETVLQGKFSAWVNRWGQEEWPRRILDGLERRNRGMFTFRIGNDGVDFT